MGNQRLMTAEEWADLNNMKNILHNCRQHAKFKLQQVINDIKKYTPFIDVYELDQIQSYDAIENLAQNAANLNLKMLHFSTLMIWVNTWLALYEMQHDENVTIEMLRKGYEDYKIVEREMHAEEVRVVGVYSQIGYIRPCLN